MGKSTLLNALLQQDLCIATARPQTTRHAILGLLTTNTTQVCLVDTPGVLQTPAYKLQQGMMEAVVGAVKGADVLLVVTDPYSTPIPNDDLFRRVQQNYKPTLVVVNKADLNQTLVEEAVVRWRQYLPEALLILPVAAAQGPNDVGVALLRDVLLGASDLPASFRNLGRPLPGMFPAQHPQPWLTPEQALSLLPHSPPLYDQESLTDRSSRFVASELIRSALFTSSLTQELPYCCDVQIQQFQELPQLIRIHAHILVERASQQRIVIGKGGTQIRHIGTAARLLLEDFFAEKVFLKLDVKVSPEWRSQETVLQQLGYLQPKKAKKKSSK